MSFKNDGAPSIGTSATSIRLAATNPDVIHNVSLCNRTDNSDILIDLYVVDNSQAETRYLLKNFPIPFGDTYIYDKQITLEDADQLFAVSNVATSLDANCSILVDD